MRLIYSLIFIAILGCSAERTSASLALAVSSQWPDKIVLVECVSEPGLETRVLNTLSQFPIRRIRINGGGCYIQIEAVLGLHSKYLEQEIELQLRTTNGVLNVTIK